MSLKSTFYHVKPCIPRYLQIFLRRRVLRWKKLMYRDIWPIDKKAGQLPPNWAGWPGRNRFALVLTHDVETREGHDKTEKLMDLEINRGFRSSFNLVPERYQVSPDLRQTLKNKGFEVGVHGLKHDGKLYSSRQTFNQRAQRINHYLKDWNVVGFRSPSMHHNLEWLHELNIQYDASTFDTDPFEPQPDGIATIFPFYVNGQPDRPGYIELPYTLPQDYTLFVLLQEKTIDIWKQKLDWIVAQGGMALLDTHPDYMNFGDEKLTEEQYPIEYYEEFLDYIKSKYQDQYWHVLPKAMAAFWKWKQNQNTVSSRISA